MKKETVQNKKLRLKSPSSELHLECVLRLPSEVADDILVDYTAYEMRKRLAEQREKGFQGWQGPDYTNEGLLKRLKANLRTGDMINVINLAAMILTRESLYTEGE